MIHLRISVVIPALNEEAFIGDCLRSLRAQTVSTEIIVVDNGSTDRTVEIASKIADRVIEAPGVSIPELRQIGVQAAVGEIIVTTDADTVAPPNWLEKLLRHFSDPDVVAVGGSIRPSEPGPMQDLYAKGLSASASIGLLSGANMAYRRDALLKASGYSKVKKGEDWVLATRLRRYGRVVFDPEAYVLTDIPFNRQIEFAAIAANFGLLSVGIATRSPLPLGLSAGFFIAEVGSALDNAPDDLHHSHIAVMGLALLGIFYGSMPPNLARFIAGLLTGVLGQHWITEDIGRPVWMHVNGSLLAGIILLIATI